ncbi:hypothetical protein CIB48_g7398 [Xylaria polymorpha]|nr:hypothetical protein CIB48_g7398 [Xylaria polymorpha]
MKPPSSFNAIIKPLHRTGMIRSRTLRRSLLSQIQYFSSRQSSNQTTQVAKPYQPLKGVTVVSIEQAIAAPFCTRQLADLGARVIKVERPVVGDFARDYDTRVDGLASHFVWTNHSKESLALDLKNLIVCNISGYGQDGPYRLKKAYDLLIQSEAGMLSVTGTGSEPAKVGISIADIAAGMYAYSNILTALLERQKTGKGRDIDISMLESMVEWMGFPMYYTFKHAPGPKPVGASHASIYPYGLFETGDNQSVMLGIQNEREWSIFCSEVLNSAELASDPRFSNNSLRVRNRDELRKIICLTFSKSTAKEVVLELDNAGIANANVNDMQGVWDHPQLRARGRWTEVGTPMGTIPALIPPGIPSPHDHDGAAVRMDSVPAVGEHNSAIFAELGLEAPA